LQSASKIYNICMAKVTRPYTFRRAFRFTYGLE
jgi:hypothetical protein